MLLVAIAGILLVYSRADAAGPFSTFDVILIAAMLLFTALSVISNISKTNLIFGFILTLIQLLFSALLILTVWALSSNRKQRRSHS
jgi:hypothetical protein